MIRGAIAFALVLRIPVCMLPEDEGCISEVNYNMLVSTTLILVVITTLGFGTFMGKVQSILCKATDEDEEEYVEMQRKNSVMVMDELKKRRNSSVYEEMTHPNEEETEKLDDYDPSAPFHWPQSSFVRWFLKVDEEKLRPFFIRKYSKSKIFIEDQYQELVKKQMDEDDDSEERDQMADKVQALAVVQTKDSRAMSEFNDRMRAMSNLEMASPYKKKSFNGPGELNITSSENLPDFVVKSSD